MASSMPKKYWSEAILCANFCVNRCPMSSTRLIPAEAWFGRDVEYEKLRQFGCLCYSHVPKEKRHKFGPRSTKYVMVGYAPFAYQLLDLEKGKVIVT